MVPPIVFRHLTGPTGARHWWCCRTVGVTYFGEHHARLGSRRIFYIRDPVRSQSAITMATDPPTSASPPVTATPSISTRSDRPVQSARGVSTALTGQRNSWYMHGHKRCTHCGLMNVVESSGFCRSSRSVLENVLPQTPCDLGEDPQPIARI